MQTPFLGQIAVLGMAPTRQLASLPTSSTTDLSANLFLDGRPEKSKRDGASATFDLLGTLA